MLCCGKTNQPYVRTSSCATARFNGGATSRCFSRIIEGRIAHGKHRLKQDCKQDPIGLAWMRSLAGSRLGMVAPMVSTTRNHKSRIPLLFESQPLSPHGRAQRQSAKRAPLVGHGTERVHSTSRTLPMRQDSL
uniref:Uncharacterized protein n=1 Tax=Craspedostauros australis TaxID=1486917 RepID=A0A7R9WUC8_9STRA|mmetsp:Transcript_19957/g.55505  ORF Transcript_19957/g.55505 Transcript_19957/m.55505 type:complete len:133 (+) Transcript_19957:959-1357(+)